MGTVFLYLAHTLLKSCKDFLYLAHTTKFCKHVCTKMAGVSDFILTDLTATHYAIAAAAVLGLIGALYVLCSALGVRISVEVVDDRETEQRGSADESSEEQEGSTKGQRQKRQQQAKAKGAKVKPQRKVTLPSHPLLAAEFKGHTGPVLSLDSDGNGKYVASCSEGQSLIEIISDFITMGILSLIRVIRYSRMKTGRLLL